LTETAQSSGPENVGPGRPLSGLLTPRQVNSLPRITLENNEKIRPEPDWEKLFNRLYGGATGTDVEPSLVDAALICKEFLNLKTCDRVRTLVRPVHAADLVPLAEMVMRGAGPNL
jgi:hypothetical protein